jgi:hypothetical protein
MKLYKSTIILISTNDTLCWIFNLIVPLAVSFVEIKMIVDLYNFITSLGKLNYGFVKRFNWNIKNMYHWLGSPNPRSTSLEESTLTSTPIFQLKLQNDTKNIKDIKRAKTGWLGIRIMGP